nr:transposase, MuDR, MULE transposase domain protein [Tanacetum cinerariifolium]
MVLYLLNDRQPNGPITASPDGIQPIICVVVVHEPQFEQQPKEVVESVPLFTSEELVAEYHSITTSVQLIENVGDGDPSIVLKELAAVKQKMNAIERFIKFKNDNLSEDSVAKQSVEKKLNLLMESRLPTKLFNTQLHLLKERIESLISDVFHGELLVVETSKNEALSEEFDPKEYDKNVNDSGVGKASESEIINVLTGQVSCGKYVGGFYECESLKLYYTDSKEYLSSSMTQLLQAAKMSMYVNEVNENQPPSSEKVVEQLMRKRFVGKALVEPYTVQPPITAPSAFLKVDRKRLKRKARLLQIQNTLISFDDDVGDDDPYFKVLALEEWESTKMKKQNKKEPTRQSQIALKEIPLVEFTRICLEHLIAEEQRSNFQKSRYGLCFRKDVPIQGDAYGDCGVWMCIFLYRLIHKMAVSAKDPQIASKAYTMEGFDKAISKLRGHRPEVVRKLKESCFEKCSRVYFPRSHYNYMTSNSVESINSLTRIVRSVPITMLVEQPNQRLKSIHINSLIRTPTREEHLSEEARLNEKRLRNRRVYMDWDDVQASGELVTTTEGMAVED